jgi:hypothetical protein
MFKFGASSKPQCGTMFVSGCDSVSAQIHREVIRFRVDLLGNACESMITPREYVHLNKCILYIVLGVIPRGLRIGNYMNWPYRVSYMIAICGMSRFECHFTTCLPR